MNKGTKDGWKIMMLASYIPFILIWVACYSLDREQHNTRNNYYYIDTCIEGAFKKTGVHSDIVMIPVHITHFTTIKYRNYVVICSDDSTTFNGKMCDTVYFK